MEGALWAPSLFVNAEIHHSRKGAAGQTGSATLPPPTSRNTMRQLDMTRPKARLAVSDKGLPMSKPRIVVVGGGAGGLPLVTKLGAKLGKYGLSLIHI